VKNYFSVVDRDVKGEDARPETLQKGLQAINSMRTTQHEKTMSGGDHLFYLSKQPVNGWKPKGTCLELLGKGNLCIMAPSEGYCRKNDNDPTVIENAEEMFHEALLFADLIKTKISNVMNIRPGEIEALPVRPCFGKLMKQPYLRHVEKVALVYEFYFTGKTRDEIRVIFHENHAWEPVPTHNYDRDETNQRLTYTIAKASEGKNYRYKRETLQEQGICFAECLLLNCPDCRKSLQNSETPQNYERFCDVHGHFKPALVAQWLKNNYNFKTDRRTEILYFYDQKTGCWQQNGEIFVQEILSIILGTENRMSYFSNVLHDLKGLTFQELTFSKKIACLNGLLDLEAVNPTLSAFSPEEMPFHSIPVTYDKDAKCPSWQQFITQVLTQDDIPTLQEWSGYLLLPDYRFHKLLWLHGEGRNGKGVWQRTMEGMLGEDNLSSVGLEEFDGSHRFALRQLYGKLFNPCTEPSTNRIMQTPLLKKATGQDTIEAEAKCTQARVKFRNYAKIKVIANKFPKNNDITTAFKERRLFLKFPNEFTGGKQIQNLENSWLTEKQEKSGILNWMIEGLKRLLSQGHFSESKTQLETEIEFQRASDTIGAFLTELGIIDRNMVTTRTDAYEAYKNYCDVMGLDLENEKRFAARLKETAKISVATISKPKRERAWKGLGLKNLNDDGSVTIVTDVTDTTLPTVLMSATKLKGEGVTAVTSVTTYSKRYCNDECRNFCTQFCSAPNPFGRSDNAEIPLKCPGYKYVNDNEEAA
jgi:P4 family phage/plasmid primase-like protien